ncbi:MAG TPA: D-alanyl-D-alanine carboxypeptidase, partial [Longimicrobiales bacterium]|nr:D-alanyl-D-alanine carboxypeptidase [Longimicrobiales bacterium]
MKRLVWLLLVIAACAPPRPQGPAPARYAFTPVADSLILRSDLNQAHWGIAVFDPARNQYLYHHDGTRHFIPASNTKLVVTTVAMGALGPDWRYRTEVRAVGGSAEPAQLVVVARGDPTWSARYHADGFAVLDQLADSIRSAGVQRINELIIDASVFGTERVHSTWEIGDLPFGYAAPTAAFAIAEGTIQLVVTPDTVVGGPANATTLGVEGIFPIRVNVRTDTANARPNVDVDYQAWPDTIVLTGSVPLGRPDTSTLAAPDPQHF